MSTASRKHHANRRMDDVTKRLSTSVADSRQEFWRLIRSVQSSSTLLARARGNVAPEDSERIVLACARISQHSERWIRSPEEWTAPVANPAIQFRSLVGHLFDLYPVPNFMSRVWLSEHEKLWEIQMYLHLSAGLSIRQFNLPVPFRLGKKAASIFMKAPDDMVPVAAMRWAQVVSLGGDSQLARQLSSRTVLAAPTKHESFWESVIRFLVRHQPISIDESEEIVQFAQDQKFRPAKDVWGPCDWEAGTGFGPLQPEFSLQGRSLRSLRRHMAHWKSELAAKTQLPSLKPRNGWERSEISPLTLKRGDEIWTVEELLTREELSAEGGIMRHCIASYAYSCRRRNSSIWSMRVQLGGQRKRVLTIQVVPSKKMIWEAKGKSNSSPSAKAQELMRIWAKQEGLQIRKR